MIDPTTPQADHVQAWIDRIGAMVFIGDEADDAHMQPQYFRAACADQHRNGTESAVWWH